MQKNKKYYWLKLKDNFFTDKRIKKLRKIAGGDTYTIIYLKMQLLSLQDDGNLYFDNIENTFEEEIALQIDEDVEDVKLTIAYLQASKLMQEIEKNVYELIETKTCIGSETKNAVSMRNLREKRNSGVTLLQNVTKCYTEKEKEKEIEIDIEKDKDKEKKYFDSPEVNQIFLEFLKLRKKIKAVNSDRAINSLINKLNKYDDETKIKMIDNSIVNSWKDVYELKENKKSTYKTEYERRQEMYARVAKEIEEEERQNGTQGS